MDEQLLQMLMQNGGVPQQQAQQQAAPSAAQPGGDAQMLGGNMTPEQQQLITQGNVFVVSGKRFCSALSGFDEDSALKCESYLNKIAILISKLKTKFAEEAVEKSITAAISPNQQQNPQGY